MWLQSSFLFSCILGLLVLPQGCFFKNSPKDVYYVDKLSEKLLPAIPFASVISEGLNFLSEGLGLIHTINVLCKDYNLFSKGEEENIIMLKAVTNRLDDLQSDVKGIEKSFRYFVKGLPSLLSSQFALNQMDGYSMPINNKYKTFTQYLKNISKFENETLINFAMSTVSDDTISIQSYMANINSMVNPKQDTRLLHMRLNNFEPGFFTVIETFLEQNQHDSCNKQLSPLQIMFGLYTMISLTQARGYIMQEYSYNILQHFKKGNYTLEREMAAERYKSYSKELFSVTKTALSRVPNSFRKCDPDNHVEGETFVMFTGLLQGYIVNESDLALDTCQGTCEDYKKTALKNSDSRDQNFINQNDKTPLCKGSLYNCRSYYSKLEICTSSSPHRRYDWIKNGNTMLGKESDSCSNKLTAESWIRGFIQCTYCLCTCDDPKSSTSDRYVSLRSTLSDINENKVVTGVKFVKNNRMLYIMVQEGKATAQGQVDPATLQWVEPSRNSVEADYCIDYFTLGYDFRTIDLDNLKAPRNHVVTGLRFKAFGGRLFLEMQITPIDFATGKLAPALSLWVENDDAEKISRKEVILVDPDDSTKSKESEVDSASNTFVTLQQTSIEKDVAQLTVPFFDAQPVALDQPSWLEGVQLYHKGAIGFGGFIGFQIYTYNLSLYLDSPHIQAN